MQEKAKNDIAKRLLKAMWNCLDFTDVKVNRIFSIWDEFIAKVRIAISTETEYGKIMNKFCSKFNINLQYDEVFVIVETLNTQEQDELFEYMRDNLQILIVDMRIEKERKNYNV